MLITGPEICHVDRCPHGCTRETGCLSIAMLKPKHLIDSLRGAQVFMRKAADHLEKAKIDDHATELRGAADIVDSWIEGIAAMDPAVPVGVTGPALHTKSTHPLMDSRSANDLSATSGDTR